MESIYTKECPSCGEIVRLLAKEDIEGNNYFECPNCGFVFDQDELDDEL